MKTTGTTTICKHGRYIHGIPQPLPSGRGYVRVDEWISDRTDRPALDSVHCATADDDTPLHSSPYKTTCSYCWLNISHTAAAHNASIRDYHAASKQ